MNKLELNCWKAFSGFMPIVASKIIFFKTHKRYLNLKDPIWFDEKLQYLKLKVYSKNLLVSNCADKYEVREYIKKLGCGDSLNKLVFSEAFETVDDIPWSKLPKQFVIKCTHGCHMNIICTNLKDFNIEKEKKYLRTWLKEKQWKEQAEIHYKYIKPRIIVEEFIPFNDGQSGLLPIDYKIYCFNGEPKIILVCSEREGNVKYNYYDLNWKKIDNIVKSELYNEKIDEKPKSFQKMLEYSRVLSQGGNFPFVRVDFYDLNGKAIFGEMTFTPSGCNDDDYTVEGQIMLGNLLKIDI